MGGVCALAFGPSGCGYDEGTDIASAQWGGGPGDHGKPSTPRPLAPLSGSMSGSRQPVLKWTPPARAAVEICADRGCTQVIESIAGNGEARAAAPLPAGIVYWRVTTNRGTSATWQIFIPARDTGRSIAWGVNPDFDADGRADLLTGAPADGTIVGGSVLINYGASIGPDPRGEFILSGDIGFGRAVAAIGDVNGDGFGDMAVAAGDGPGSVFTYHGSSSGFEAKSPLYAGPVSRFGTSMSSAGDVNGDGYGDLLVGGAEIAQVYLGSANGVSLGAAFGLSGATGSPFTGEASVVQGPADVNGDGHPDVFVSGLLYLGNGSGFDAQAGFVGGTFGGFAGDHNGDGFVDFGDYQVSPGTPTGVDVNQTLFVQAGEYVFASAGDFDGDGFGDVLSNVSDLVGAPERDRLYFGAAGACGDTGCRPFVQLAIPGRSSSGASPTTFIAAVGDVDGDGTTDILAATPSAGRSLLFLGSPDRSSPRVPVVTFGGSSGSFGSSIASLFGTARPAL